LLSIERIRPDEDQVRRQNKSADDQEIQELAASIKAEGLLQPINVRYIESDDCYEIIAGERRYTAAKLAGLAEVPVKLVEADEHQVKKLQLIENIHRAELSPVELGSALQALVDEGATVDELCTLLHKSRPYVQKALSIARNLSAEVKEVAKQTPERFQDTETLYQVSQLPAPEQSRRVEQIATKRLTRQEVRRVTAAAKQTVAKERVQRRGRPAKSKPYSKSITTDDGARVTITFRKARATNDEVITALQKAIHSLKRPAA
jgi:ParB family chromosome partitioning protein